jgi:hypothetical protein
MCATRELIARNTYESPAAFFEYEFLAKFREYYVLSARETSALDELDHKSALRLSESAYPLSDSSRGLPFTVPSKYQHHVPLKRF